MKVINAQHNHFQPSHFVDIMSSHFPQSHLTEATDNLGSLGFVLQQSLIVKSLTLTHLLAGQSIAHIQTLNQLSKQVLTFRNSGPLSWLTVWLMMHLWANSLTSTLVYFKMTDSTQRLKQEGGRVSLKQHSQWRMPSHSRIRFEIAFCKIFNKIMA